jgi:exonuclease VII large subunit
MQNLDNSIKSFKEKLLNLTERIKKEIFNFTLNKKKDLGNKRKELSILSYKDTLKRGFAVVRNKSRLVSDDNDLKLNDILEIEFFKNKTLAKKIK